MNLYQIAHEELKLLHAIEQQEGELDPAAESRLTALAAAKDDKLEACCAVLKNLSGIIELHEKEITRLKERKEIFEHNYERLKTWVAANLGEGNSWERGLHRLSWRKSKSVEVDDAEKLPLEFTRVKLEADKTALKKALEGGATFKGVRLLEKQTLTVK